MTTSTTDAEAIARDLNGATSLVIEQMHEAGMPICMREGETTWRTYYAGFDLSLFAQRITDACCDAILSYLASRREAQEPVDWIYEDELPSSYPYGRMFAYSKVRDGVRMFPVYAPPSPAPAGEVERLLAEMQPHIDKIERCAGINDEWGRVVTGQTDAAREIARIARAALNGGRE